MKLVTRLALAAALSFAAVTAPPVLAPQAFAAKAGCDPQCL